MPSRTLFALPVLLALSSPTTANPQEGDSGPLARAASLRDQSVAHFRSKDYQKAVELLAAADAIYREEDGEFAADRAVVLRALVYNLNLAGMRDRAARRFEALSTLVAGHVGQRDELNKAYYSMFETVHADATITGQEATMRQLRRLLRGDGHARLAAHVLHDLAGFVAESGDVRRMARLYKQCAVERMKLKDYEGAAWSHNNRGYHYLGRNMLREGVAGLAEAIELVLAGKATQVQTAIAQNLGRVVELLRSARSGKREVRTLWRLARRAVASQVPPSFPPDRLLRTALAAEIAVFGAEGVALAAKKLLAVKTPRLPGEVRTDLILRAAAAALRTPGQHKLALRWLQAMKTGGGPCSAHLNARREVWLAVAHAKADQPKQFDTHARAARDAFEELGDFAGFTQALEQLVGGVGTLQGSDALGKLRAELERRKLMGGPGGDAASNFAIKPADLPRDFPDHRPLFSVRATDRGFEFEDLLGGARYPVKTRWKPNRFNFNGLGVECFGGYIVVHSVDYGVVKSEGARGATTLDELGSYVPVPARGRLLVTKNGAVIYEKPQGK